MFNAFRNWRLSSATALVVLTLGFIFTGGLKAWAQQDAGHDAHQVQNHDMGTRGEGHTPNHDWYQDLKQPGTGYSCCNGTLNGVEGDCRPTRAYLLGEGQKCGDFNGGPGDWCALVDGVWHLVPGRTVLQKLAPDGRSHICAGRSGMIYCFLGGSPKS